VTDGGPDGVTDGGPDGVPDRGQTGWPDGMARRRARQGRTGCPMGGETEGQTGLDGVPDEGGQTEGQTGPDGVLDGCLTGWLDGVPDGARREPCHRPRHF
jgi:hypothetical protein